MDLERQRLLRHLRTGLPVRVERLMPPDGADPTALARLARDLRELQEEGLIRATPYGWLWRPPSQ